jgi:uncharacterized protein
MWRWVSHFILKNRITLLVVLSGITIVMAYYASKVEMSYDNTPMVPQKDQAYKDYQKFHQIFGEEGNLIAIGIQDDQFFNIEHFKKWRKLCSDLTKVEGVENLISVSNSYDLVKNSEQKLFGIKPIFPDSISGQAQLDSLATRFRELPFYRSMLYNGETNTYLLAITVNKDKMLTKSREKMILSIKSICQTFEKENKVSLHYSGLPYIRVMNSVVIKRELYLFSLLALAMCVAVLFIFFKSFKAVIFPALVVIMGVIWSVGMMAMFGYKMTILTGKIPPIIIVIGIPNSIYMLNKYHREFMRHGNKIKALQRVIMRLGNATFMTNLTASAGFATFIIVKSDILRQFGIIASLNIMGLFILCLLVIPICYSFIKPPTPRNVKHLQSKFLSGFIERIIYITGNHRKAIYIGTIILVGIGIYGVTLVKSSGTMVDDIPKKDPIYKDLKFFESNFDGLMPLEIIIDTKKPNGVMQLATFKKMDQIEKKLMNIPELSPSLSLLNVLKFAKQAFYNGKEAYYDLPNSREKDFILSYASKGQENLGLLHSFLDSTKQTTRITIRMKDVGMFEMERLYNNFKADVDSIFPAKDYNVIVTGSSVIFFKGNKYLLHNLFLSLALALFLISACMASLFSSARMVILSLVPNIIALLFTAAIMGFTGIPIKSSTILIFSVAFGIVVDTTIHYLTKYRQELKATNWNIRESVVLALRETGFSMIYTSIVLFFGFGIFSLSNFGGTVALGVLVSLTLLIAITLNLILLPALLSGLEKITTTRSFEEALIPIFEEEDDSFPESFDGADAKKD